MFDVSFVELMVIGVVALIVLGPEKLPIAARTVGSFVRRARSSWNSVRGELEREFAAEELKRSMRETRASLDETARAVDLSAEVRLPADEIRESVASAHPMKALGHATEPHDAAPSVPAAASELPFEPVAPPPAEAAAAETASAEPAYSPTTTYAAPSAVEPPLSATPTPAAPMSAAPTSATPPGVADAGDAPDYRPHG